MTSNHDGVSCDSCRKNNFRGLRYKCLICYDYDLCSICYEGGITSSRHTVNHPMQCIVAKNDFDLFYAGESVSSDQPQSLTCPLCGCLGFTESSLLDHVTSDHSNSDNEESSAGVVCPICGVETNQLTYDFATHLTMEHRGPREPVEQVTIRGRGGRCLNRTGMNRGRRPQCGGVVGTFNEGSDPLVEMLAQLSSVRRAGSASSQSPASQLHQLHMHLQSSPSFCARNRNDHEVRIMRRTFQSMNNQLNSSSASISTAIPATGTAGSAYSNSGNTHYCSSQPFVLMDQSSLGSAKVSATSGSGGGATCSGLSVGAQPSALSSQLPVEGSSSQASQYLLSRCMKPVLTEAEQQQREILKADRSLFVQELLLQVGLLEKIK